MHLKGEELDVKEAARPAPAATQAPVRTSKKRKVSDLKQEERRQNELSKAATREVIVIDSDDDDDHDDENQPPEKIQRRRDGQENTEGAEEYLDRMDESLDHQTTGPTNNSILDDIEWMDY